MFKRITLAAAALCVAWTPALADGDAAEGEKVYRKCKSCHEVGEDAKNKVGPILNGIVGANAGQVADFKYSDALMEAAAAGLVWDEETLAKFLEKPKDLIEKTKMSFAGLRKEDDIEDVIAYLMTFQ